MDFPTIDWHKYPHVTDHTIFSSVIREQFQRDVTGAEIVHFQDRFVSLLERSRERKPADFKMVPFAREIVLENMLKTGKSASQISIFELNFNKDVEAIKDRSIKLLKVYHPSFFDSMLEFDDWSSAMDYLQIHREEVFKFWETMNDRKN